MRQARSLSGAATTGHRSAARCWFKDARRSGAEPDRDLNAAGSDSGDHGQERKRDSSPGALVRACAPTLLCAALPVRCSHQIWNCTAQAEPGLPVRQVLCEQAIMLNRSPGVAGRRLSAGNRGFLLTALSHFGFPCRVRARLIFNSRVPDCPCHTFLAAAYPASHHLS
jgi:hypothetical protein